MQQPWMIVAVFLVGGFAGAVGGLSGIGGSIIMLPALAFLLGYATPDRREHHIYMAAAMAVNAVVAAGASRRHMKAGAVRWDLVAWVAPAMVVGVVGGVLLSYAAGAGSAMVALALLTAGFCVHNVVRAFREKGVEPVQPPRRRRREAAVGLGVGAVSGVAAGFMGIGGGVLTVPGLTVSGVTTPKGAVATSAVVMVVTAVIGASLKFGLLGREGLEWESAALLAVPMGAGAMVGAPLGAALTHRLSTRWLRLSVSAILAVSAAKLGGLI